MSKSNLEKMNAYWMGDKVYRLTSQAMALAMKRSKRMSRYSRAMEHLSTAMIEIRMAMRKV